MDSHDITRPDQDYFDVLESITVPSIIVSISSDVLYPASEQMELAQHMPNAQHHMIESPEGHDGFLLEHTKMSVLIRGFLAENMDGIQPLRERPSEPIVSSPLDRPLGGGSPQMGFLDSVSVEG